MRRESAEPLIDILRQCTPGWTPEAFNFYVEHAVEHWTINHELPGNEFLPSETEIGYEVIDQVCMTWRNGYRPPWAELMENWRSVLRRLRQLQPVPTDGPDSYPTAKEGRRIAAAAYVDESRLQGREPNWEMFDKIIGKIGADDE
ncbi:MAG: hypothetical protein EHM63_05225 [Actinobacteria bacterium]|nr:MAG: hypothetical protein EHM63_05225 [Actinomycetota bacterium]